MGGVRNSTPSFFDQRCQRSLVSQGDPILWTTANFYPEMGMKIEIQLQRQPWLSCFPTVFHTYELNKKTAIRENRDELKTRIYWLARWVDWLIHWYWHGPETQAPAACCRFFSPRKSANTPVTRKLCMKSAFAHGTTTTLKQSSENSTKWRHIVSKTGRKGR